MSVVDTNVLVHSSNAGSPDHARARATLAEATADTDAFAQRFPVLEDGPAVWAELMALSRRFAPLIEVVAP